MSTTIRRVLLVIVILAAALPWLTDTTPVYAQDDAPTQQDSSDESPEGPTAAPKTGADKISVPNGGLIAIIEIEGAIMYSNQVDSIQRRVDRAVQDGADLIVFELNTPGGEIHNSIKIAQLIRSVSTPTVAWVNDRALSAGVLIGSSCDALIMAKGGLTGDCGPIVPGRDMANSERAKILSYLLAEFKANAQANYNGTTTSDYAVFHAMCVLGIEVYQVRHKITGEVRLVNAADYAVMVDGVSPIDAAGIGPGPAGDALVDPDSGDDLGRPEVSVTQAEMGRWELVGQVHNGSTFLTINSGDALSIGLSRATISGEADLLKHYGAGRIKRYHETWSESLVGFLVHPIVRACLLLLAIAGILIEYFSPGLFVPGIIGVAALATLVGAPFLVGLAQTWHLVIIVLGVALAIFELMTMTTYGILAVVGLLMFLAGLVLSGVQTATNGLPAPGSGRQVIVASMSFVGALVVMVPLFMILTRYFGSLPLLNKMVLIEKQAPLIPLEGSAPVPYQHVAGDESVGGGAIRPGMTGRVSSTGLRPGGRVEIDGQLIDVTSTGGFVEPGTTVRVVEVHGNVISVEPAGTA